MNSMVRSNSLAASPADLQISHIRMLTNSERRVRSASTNRSIAAMREARGICGHVPCPRSHAAAAAVTASTASSSPESGSVPIFMRSFVSRSNTGEVTVITLPL